MYKQLAALFSRYAAAHLVARGRPQPIYTEQGQLIGTVDVFHIADGQIRLAGWAVAEHVVLHMNGIKASTKPTLRRDDVATKYGLDPSLGFDLMLPLGPVGLLEIARFGVEIHNTQGRGATVAVPLFLQHVYLIRLLLVGGFLLGIFRQFPACCAWLITRNPIYRSRIKRGLKLTAIPVARELDPDLFRAPVSTFDPKARVTLIMPVFNAFEVLQNALSRIANNTDLPWRMILIEDCSTDDRIRPMLREWQKLHPDQVLLVENAENVGFIASVNKGIEKALLFQDPVVLLNSDTLLPPNWATRLVRPMLDDNSVATVTPMSNDAEIYTLPIICHPQTLTPGQGDIIDATAARLNPKAERVSAPTGVGFCMAINLIYLRQLPFLDPKFGRGYGEEVDWCQRARRVGGKHVCAPNLFVEHRGGQSFGTDEKRRLIAQNNELITKRYPKYDTDVQNFIRSDPLQSTRLALALAWVGSQETYTVSIYLAHSMGGGAEAYLQDRISRKHLAIGQSAVVLRVGGPMRWRLELVTPHGTISGLNNSFEYIYQMLAPIKQRQIIYSCGVGDNAPVTLPGALLSLSEHGRHPIEVLFHDYFVLSPSYTLLDGNGTYRGLPRPGDPDHEHFSAKDQNGEKVTLEVWQTQWHLLVSAAKTLTVFSRNSAKIVAAAYPEEADKIFINPHTMLHPVPRLPVPNPEAKRVIGILGDIGAQKGAGVIAYIARPMALVNVRLVIIGNFDPSFRLPTGITVHGSYKISDLPQIASRYGITDWLIPSIWPETFSFTTHEALSTGLPVHAFHLGAQGDAVEDAQNGIPVRYGEGEAPQEALRRHLVRYLNQSKRAA